MANKKKRRPYTTLGRRFLSVLDTGARKMNVLIGLAKSLGHEDKFARTTIRRLARAGIVTVTNCQGGATVALAKA
jgi:DNA-binding transcriptional regulator PaaX